jgi:hypothetical protein
VLYVLVPTLAVLSTFALSHLKHISFDQVVVGNGFKPTAFRSRVVLALIVGFLAILLGVAWLHHVMWARKALKWSVGVLLAYYAYGFVVSISSAFGHPPHGRRAELLLLSWLIGAAWSVGLIMLFRFLSRPTRGVQHESTQPTV